MLEPLVREQYVAAIKASLDAAGLTMSEAARRLGKSSSWVSSLVQRVREGHNPTVESVRTLRQEAPSLDEHLRAAGWTAGGPQTRGRPAIVARNNQVLRQYRSRLMLQRDDLDRQIVAVTAQIAEVEVK
jgi:transcriptional regulator with XRE-family HTH domain